MFKEIFSPQRIVEKIKIHLEWPFSIFIFHDVGFTFESCFVNQKVLCKNNISIHH